MGLLDSLTQGSQGGYGGLLDMLMYPSQQPQAAPQPQYDPMGNYTGVTPQNAPDPFGPPPQMGQWAQQFAPQTPFNGTTPAAPVQFAAGPTVQPQQPAAPPPPAPVNSGQVNDAMVGGYSMPRLGSVADFTPQAPQGMPTDVSAQSRQAPPQPQQPPPSFGEDSYIDRINNGGSLIGSLFGSSQGQQSKQAIYNAAIQSGLSKDKAFLVATNPKAFETFAPQLLGSSKQYGFTKLDNDTIIRTDPLRGTAEVAYGSERSNTIQGPDGKLIQMPEGADAKTWRNEITRINADVAAGKKTEVQAKAEIFGNKMELSNKAISDGVGTSLAGKIASGLPMGNYVQSPEYQKYKQASSNFITALLRQESGAAISKTEFDRYDKEYMPQPGDGPEVLSNKAEARRVAIEGMKKGAGPGYKSPTDSPASAAALPSGWSVRVR